MSEHATPAVVLVRPTEQGNIGAAARAMANMGLSELVLVEPAPPFGRVARAFAVGAGHILDGARRAPDLASALAPYRRLVGTTSSRERRLGELVDPRALPEALAADPPDTPTALVFGPEASGLTNDELAPMSPIVQVPCALEQPTLNLAQAVLLLAWELRAAALGLGEGRAAGGQGPDAATVGSSMGLEASFPRAAAEPPAASEEIEGLRRQVEETLAAVGFARDDTAHGVVRDLRRLAARAGLTRREVTILRGICRRTLHAVRRPRG